MGERPATSIAIHFSSLPDPRVERTRWHELLDILTIALLAVLCGADGWEDMEEFGESKRKWLETFLPLSHGIPCADTFRRVFEAIDPGVFERCFMSWVGRLAKSLKGKVVAIDGKTLRGSYDRASGQSPLHLVHAYAAEQHLLLGQVATEMKSNEITAIPELMSILDLEGSVVTIDAMGCQTKIAEQIIGAKADYVLALKGNQGMLHGEVADYFTDALQEQRQRSETVFDFSETVDGDHGRIETRKAWTTSEIGWFADAKKWAGLKSFICVEGKREIGGEVTCERRYYISSVKDLQASEALKLVRSHWAIENSLHWSLDVAFNEDACRIRRKHAPRNVSLLRKLALTLLKRTTASKRGLAAKSRRAGWDHDFLLAVLRSGE